jgi:hypothetical protein
MSNSKPIACDVTTLTKDETKFLTAVSFELFATIQEVKNLSDGYAFRLQENSDTIRRLFDFVALDRICCPFVLHTIVVGAKGEAVWLHLTGYGETKHFITSEFMSFPDSAFAPKLKEDLLKLSKMPSGYK